MENEQLKKNLEKIREFVRVCRHIYIYGAGNFGRGYLDILQDNGYDADGFIVTEKHTETYLDKPVYSVDELSYRISEEDGVIPAYTNSDIDEIKHKFVNACPKVLDFDHKVMLQMENELHFLPLMDCLDREFPESEKEINRSAWKKILIVRLDAIGDMVLTTPFIRELRKNFPESHISLVLRRQNEKLLESCPYIDQFYLYDSELIGGELAEQCKNYPKLSEKVRKFMDENFQNQTFDVVFFPRELLCGRNSIDELLIAYYSGAKYRIGRMLSDDPDKQFICERLKKSFTLISNPLEPMHEAAYALDMLKQCGCKVTEERMELWVSDSSEEKAARIWKEYQVDDSDKVIALGIVASVETRTWKIENYNEILRFYGKRFGDKVRFVIMGGGDARDAAGHLEVSYGNIMNLVGKTDLNETAACMKKCNLYVGSNTGLLHLASAFGVASVTVYSELSDGNPTDGDSPFRMGAWKVPHIDLVPPAGLDGCHGVCRMGFSHCINQITPDRMIDSINKLLGLGETIEKGDMIGE